MNDSHRQVLSSGWLAHVPPDLSAALIGAARPVHYSEGETIYGFEQPQSCLFGIAVGTVRMWVTMNEHPPRFAHIAGPGFWFGETELLTGKGGIMEMIASEETLVYAIDRSAIGRLAEKIPAVWQAIALLAVMNQGTAIGAADDLLIRKSRQRLAAVLLRLFSLRNASQGVPPLERIPITRAELADGSNLSESLTAALLSEFEAAGLIRRQYAAIKLLDATSLAELLVQ